MVAFNDAIKKEIIDRWTRMKIREDKLKEVEKGAVSIVKNKDRYKKVEALTGVPWWFIGIIHSLECSLNFKQWLANGDPISSPTVHEPKGLECDGTWEDAAVVSLKHEGYINQKDWNVPHSLWLFECYNGLGYRNRGKPSQYVWSFTNIEEPGRYVADRVWSDTAMSDQVGCASLLAILLRGEIATDAPTPPPPSDNTIVRWAINKDLPSDVRGYNSTGKCVCYLDTQMNFEVLCKSALNNSIKTAKYSIETLPAKPPVVPAPPKTEPPLELRNGDTNPAVIELKKMLNDKFGASLSVTGELAPVFGDKTESEVKRVQTLLNLPVDGTINASDLEIMRSYQVPEKPSALDFSSTLEHLKNVKSDKALNIEEVTKMWSAMQSQIQDKVAFNTRVNLGVKPAYGNAQCATTTASVLEGAAIKAGLTNVAELFSKLHRDKDEFALTHQVEIMLKRLGFVMYSKATHIAPQGAIGLMANRYEFAGCKKHSGHVYSIYEDKGVDQKDIICDNGGWNHTYVNNTESFFVPSNIKVQKRIEDLLTKALLDEATKWIGVHETGGNNKGKEIEAFQKAVDGQASGEAWCMAFVQYCIKQVEAAQGTKSSIFRTEHCLTCWQKSPTSIRLSNPEIGSVVIWQHGTSTSGHTGFFKGFDKDGNMLTIEGNTNSEGSSEGDGVYAKVRNRKADGTLNVVGFLKVF